MQTTKYVRKPFLADAVQVTAENMADLAVWCGGTVEQETRGKRTVRYIKVDVKNPLNDRQTKAYSVDWLVFSKGGYKVYTDRAFNACFEVYDAPSETVGQEQLTGLADKLNTPK